MNSFRELKQRKVYRIAAHALVFSLLCAARLQAQRQTVEAEHGLVTSANMLASQAGLEVLQRGGNAVDAAIATGLALTVVYPHAGNIGGGGFMLIHRAGNDARQIAIDFREIAPAGAIRDMFVGSDGNVMQGRGSSTVGWRASGVPGSVAGFAHALEKYGPEANKMRSSSPNSRNRKKST
jgi:gamma-glutamyltranspeptidase / glutathione hydrolase